MGEVIAFAEVVRRRRRRMLHQQHVQCVEILRRTVEEARRDIQAAPPAERWLRSVRLRKLEDLHAYARMLG